MSALAAPARPDVIIRWVCAEACTPRAEYRAVDDAKGAMTCPPHDRVARRRAATRPLLTPPTPVPPPALASDSAALEGPADGPTSGCCWACKAGLCEVHAGRNGPVGGFLVAPQILSDVGKPVFVFDLDETLVYARDGPLQLRPGAQHLVSALAGRCEVMVWTAGERQHAQRAVEALDPGRVSIRHCVFRHPLWFSGRRGQVKDLRRLGRSLRRLVMVDNTPDAVRLDLRNSIVVSDWTGDRSDTLLSDLLPLFLQIAHDVRCCGASVPDLLDQCPLLSRRSLCTELGDTIPCHTLKGARYPHSVDSMISSV